MKTLEVPITRVGKSRGVRLPAEVLRRYQIRDKVVMEQRRDGIVLRAGQGKKLSWAATAKAMAAAKEDWSAWESAVADGLNEL